MAETPKLFNEEYIAKHFGQIIKLVSAIMEIENMPDPYVFMAEAIKEKKERQLVFSAINKQT